MNTTTQTTPSAGITKKTNPPHSNSRQPLPEIIFLCTYPPRECGIATYSQDLITALRRQFSHSFIIRVCTLENGTEKHMYDEEPLYKLDTGCPNAFEQFTRFVNNRPQVQIVMIQHEFGLFEKNQPAFLSMLARLEKPVVLAFHTVLPRPDKMLRQQVRKMARLSQSIVVMTKISCGILVTDYQLPQEQITIIPHGTHLVAHADKNELKLKFGLAGRSVLCTFGLLSSGKSIETTLEALPAVVQINPAVLFLIIGKTHPAVVKQEGEQYRHMLEEKVAALQLQQHVRFLNQFLPLPQLLEYLQLTDIYLFTSRDPNQAVSGTFAYAISCGCPVISTPIPHAREVLQNGQGLFIDFGNAAQLATAINGLFADEAGKENISRNGLQEMAATAWENAAIAHARLFEHTSNGSTTLSFDSPPINLNHIKNMTTDFGMIQFARFNQPDPDSGYTLDDNARALIALCRHYELTRDEADTAAIARYFRFIKYCMQPEGYFLNYVNINKTFTAQNHTTNLADANGRAIWALGYMLSMAHTLTPALEAEAANLMQHALLHVNHIHSTRAMAFIIKGLYYRSLNHTSLKDTRLIKHFADRLVQMYRHETDAQWHWFESYLTYANSILPEAMLCAWRATGDAVYKETARHTFSFLLQKTFTPTGIKVISNKTWLHHGKDNGQPASGGEQPIDVAYTILALEQFYEVFGDAAYRTKMQLAFTWFLGNNHLHQVIYNPCTGGCYDGLETGNVNLNQGAESTVSYLLARLTMEKYGIIHGLAAGVIAAPSQVQLR